MADAPLSSSMDLEQVQTMNQAFGVAGAAVEAVGIAVILVGFVMALASCVPRLRSGGTLAAYRDLRIGLGRSLIVGLEFLIAGDIIRTVTVTQTLESAGVLAVIVLIRVVLALTLELEIGERTLRRTDRSHESAAPHDTPERQADR
ncbi:MAG: DUF1622 domain-containing protein [Burkholderiaceae bacterium]|nr:DUF1622 domain-containing protein [Burkholderiaceae bacterium]